METARKTVVYHFSTSSVETVEFISYIAVNCLSFPYICICSTFFSICFRKCVCTGLYTVMFRIYPSFLLDIYSNTLQDVSFETQ